ncbi:MAG: hypothetical protein M3065_10095 [Actinomycetota bacterium]|nr:hypothetical protein [Actinomycetota bacterium]
MWAASEAGTYGPGGVALLARVTGLSEGPFAGGWASLSPASGSKRVRCGARVAGDGRSWTAIWMWSGIWIG